MSAARFEWKLMASANWKQSTMRFSYFYISSTVQTRFDGIRLFDGLLTSFNRMNLVPLLVFVKFECWIVFVTFLIFYIHFWGHFWSLCDAFEFSSFYCIYFNEIITLIFTYDSAVQVQYLVNRFSTSSKPVIIRLTLIKRTLQPRSTKQSMKINHSKRVPFSW